MFYAKIFPKINPAKVFFKKNIFAVSVFVIASFLCKGSSPNFVANIRRSQGNQFTLNHQKTYGFCMISGGIESS